MNEEGGKKKKKKGGKKSFDIMTVIGLVVGLGLMVFGIGFTTEPKPPVAPNEAWMSKEDYDKAYKEYEENMANYEAYELTQFRDLGAFRISNLTDSFIDVPSIAITIGGCFAALMIAFPISSWAKFPKWVSICFMPSKYDPDDYIDQIVEFAKEARIKGLLSLEDKLAEASDPFLKSSLMLVVDSVEPEKVHNLLQAELDKLDERHGVARSFMDQGGAFAPGFGMIGTLIGLINMLKDMSDPNAIGPAMATALLTTLYGSMLANLLFSPMSNKLGIRHSEEYLCRELICEGVEAIQAGENPKFIEEKLNLLVAQKKKKGKKAKKGKGGDDE
ncbi:MotA/TolQ/ExbB proton channel family protein [Ruminococcaceae bacterium OttesenSCG-928-O06]|nr:MotA/TolQ/ExbB proton channel family protein [Ruminococcaceae bacterium OttesenSCG-928-O06]